MGAKIFRKISKLLSKSSYLDVLAISEIDHRAREALKGDRSYEGFLQKVRTYAFTYIVATQLTLSQTL